MQLLQGQNKETWIARRGHSLTIDRPLKEWMSTTYEGTSGSKILGPLSSSIER